MAEVTEFAHGYHYGDYSGVIFYGSPTNGFWLDRLAVSNRYTDPLFHAVLDLGEPVPRLASDWNTLDGWVAGVGPLAVSVSDAIEFAEALACLHPTDVVNYCAGCTVEECLRCAAVIREFISSRLARGVNVFIEDD